MKETSIKKSVGIIAAAKYSNAIFTLFANVILARLLSAEDYGIVGIVTVFITFFQLIADMGLGTGVIQNKSLSQADIENVFSFTFYVSAFLSILLCLASFLISYLFENGVYIYICLLLSISVFFYTYNMIPNAVLLRKKEFKKIGLRTIIVGVTSYSIAIFLASLGFKYYSLVAQAIVSSVLLFCWNYYNSGLKIQLVFKYASIKKIQNYSSYDFGFNIVGYFARNADKILVGKFLGSSSLGYYQKAYTLMLYPISYLTDVITPVLHPILSEHQNDIDFIYDKYMKIFKVLSLLGIFISTICYYASREIVLILYGNNWADVIPCIAFLGTSIWFQMTSSSCGSIYKSLGKTNLMFKSSLIYVPIQLLLIILGIFCGNIVLLSKYVALSYVFKFVIEYFFLIRLGFHKPMLNFYRMILPELVIVSCLVLMMEYTSTHFLFESDDIWMSFFTKIATCICLYVFMLIVTKQYKLFYPFNK